MKFAFPTLANGKLFLIGLAAVVGPWSLYLLSVSIAAKRLEDARRKEENETIQQLSATKTIKTVETSPAVTTEVNDERRRILIIYGTCTGTARKFAAECAQKCQTIFPSTEVDIKVIDAKDYDEFVLDQEDIVLFICSTWTDGVAPETAQRLVSSLIDYASDFRVSKSHLAKVKFAVFGLGGSDYNKNFCKAAKDINGEFVRSLYCHVFEQLVW